MHVVNDLPCASVVVIKKGPDSQVAIVWARRNFGFPKGKKKRNETVFQNAIP